MGYRPERVAQRDAEFRELTERHRRELTVHCYRMLGSLADAEDMLQETLLRAWQGLGEFEGRSSLPPRAIKRLSRFDCLTRRESAPQPCRDNESECLGQGRPALGKRRQMSQQANILRSVMVSLQHLSIVMLARKSW